MKKFSTKNGDKFLFNLDIPNELISIFNKECKKKNNRNKLVNIAIEHYLKDVLSGKVIEISSVENAAGIKHIDEKLDKITEYIEKLGTVGHIQTVVEGKLQLSDYKEPSEIPSTTGNDTQKEANEKETTEDIEKTGEDNDIIDFGNPQGF